MRTRTPVLGSLRRKWRHIITAVVSSLPATSKRLHQYREAQLKDPECSLVAKYCQTSWPEKQTVKAELSPYWKLRGSLTMHDGLLLFDDCIVVPLTLREETISRVHKGHQGIERCRIHAKQSVWWRGMSTQLSEAANCPECAKHTTVRKESLMQTPLPDYPWQMIGTDLFMLKGDTYLLVVDYYSRFPEVTKLSSTLSTVIADLFARHGILRSDNCPQYSSDEFRQFM